ncbi:hypothetical protein [Streptomyces werraensis]|uniref:hypothetical protein n=1 Tax=Streptomyces werraensis TaxID=68284 RepID=UPI0033A5D85D
MTKVDLVGEARVRGRMTVAPDKEAEGRAVITADYTFVHGVARAGGEETTRVIVRRVLQVDVADLARYRGTEGRLWIRDHASETSNDDCRRGDGLINPFFFGDRAPADRRGPRPVRPQHGRVPRRRPVPERCRRPYTRRPAPGVPGTGRSLA